MTVTPVNPFSRNGAACAARLDLCLPFTFIQDEDETLVTVTHSNDITSRLVYNQFEDPMLLKQHLAEIKSSKLKIITFCCDFSESPLRITKSALRDVVRDLDISVDFAPVLLAFGESPRVTEQGYGCFSSNFQDDESYVISYLYRFVERNERREWTPRQMGIYHSQNKASNSHVWIILQPRPDSENLFAQHLDSIRRVPEATKELLENSFRLHELLIGSFLDNWRWYLRDLGKEFQKQDDRVFTANFNTDRPFSLNFETLQKCKDMLDRVIPLAAVFDAIFQLLHELQKIEDQGNLARGRISSLEVHKAFVSDTRRSCDVFERRIQGVVEMLDSTLDLKNQRDSARVNDHLLNLTLHSVDDSATVRVITLVTLFYLPASFVGTVIGMNLFTFDIATQHVVVARDFWIYVVICVPLTVFTFVLWAMLSRRARKRRDDRRQGMGLGKVVTLPT